MIPPDAMPMALPKGIEAFQIPRILARFSGGNSAEIKAVPPGAYPASPIPMAILALKSCLKFLLKTHTSVARLHSIAISPMAFFLLQRSTRMETGKENRRMDQ